MIDFRERPAYRPKSGDLLALDMLSSDQANAIHWERLAARGLWLVPYDGGWRVVPRPAERRA
jgi:hypothetical protein